MERSLSKASLALANPMEHLKGLDNATKNLVLREGTMFAFITGLFKIKGTVLPEVTIQVLLNIAVTVVAFKVGCVLDDDDVTLNGALCFPSTTGHAIVGSILGFLLVFRTNISYTRFFEGRSNLGGMMNFIRDMSMILEVHCFTNDDEGQQRRFDCRRKINLAYGFVRQTLRESRHGFRPKSITSKGKIFDSEDIEISNPKEFFESDIKWVEDPEKPLMKGMLVQGEIERYKSIPVPLRATITIMDLNLIVKELGERKILEPEQVREFDRAASGFLNCFRTCCRVVEPGTFPYQYAHLLNLACFMFVYSIPFAFAGSSVKWHSSIGIPIAIGVMISTVYYGIQRIAADLIDPFGWEANDYDLGVFGLKIETETKAIAAVNPGKIETFVGPNRWKVP